MKPFFKIIFLSFILSVVFMAFSHAQNIFTIHSGYSWSKGIIGVETQINHIGVSVGYFPIRMVGKDINSIGMSSTYYLNPIDYSSFYTSLGLNTAGYRKETLVDGRHIEPMDILILGYKRDMDFLYIKGGIGYGWSFGGGEGKFEILLGAKIFRY